MPHMYILECVDLSYYVDDAWARERQVHGWSRAKKKALIEGRISDVRNAARRRRPRST